MKTIETDPFVIAQGLKWCEIAGKKLTSEYKKNKPEAYKAIKNAIIFYKKSDREYRKYAKQGLVGYTNNISAQAR